MATDAFTYSDGDLYSRPGGNWTNISGNPVRVVSNTIRSPAGSFQFGLDRYTGTGADLGADHYSQLEITELATSAYGEAGVYTRMVNSGGFTGYYGWIANNGEAQLMRVDSSSSFNTLDSTTGLTTTGTKTIRLESIGSTHKFYIDGVEVLSATDSTYTGHYAGVALYTDSSGGQQSGDNWVGDVATASVTGTAAITLASFTTTASGTVTDPAITGTAAITLGDFTTTASGTVTVPSIDGTAAITLDTFTPTASGTFVGAITGTAAITLGSFIALGTSARYPASVSGRKILDQGGDPYLLFTMSSWSLHDLSDADITTALEGYAALFPDTGVTVWSGGGYDLNPIKPSNTDWQPKYERKADSSDWWTGTPWQSSFGDAWNAMDHIADETLRLNLVLSFSFAGGYGSTGARADMEAATNAQMITVGETVAARYPVASYPNIIWHFMIDDNVVRATTYGDRINALFEGINNIEGASARPVRWMEPHSPATTDSQGWYLDGETQFTINCWYSAGYGAPIDESVEIAEDGYADVSGAPVGDCEPPYDGRGAAGGDHYSGNLGQQLRERMLATFLEGGVLYQHGHESWWPFGKEGLFDDEGLGGDYLDVLTHNHTLQISELWLVVKEYVRDLTWAPNAFVTTGEGSGDTKAAVGGSDTAALAYFPSTRASLVVDTTVITGTGPVRLRWFDPVLSTYTVISASEAQNASRSITYPSAHADSTNDWLLVVDEAPPIDGTAAITLADFTTTASGTVADAITGTAAITLAVFTTTASGTVTTPNVTGTAAITLAAFTTTASGTFTPSAITGTAAITLGSFIVVAMEAPLTNITVVVGPPTLVTRSASGDTVDRSVTHDTVSRASGLPDFVDRSASHDTVDRDANDPETADRSATIDLGHGSPDPPTF